MSTTISDGHVVTLHYRLKLDDGTVADESFGGEPLAYLHGHRNIVAGLEKHLTGKPVGAKLDAVVPPSEGYGEYDPQLDQAIPRDKFPADADLQVGIAFQAETPDGQPIPLWIRDIQGDQVTVSPSHPMAGQNLHFSVEILDIRDATAEELANGHLQGDVDDAD